MKSRALFLALTSLAAPVLFAGEAPNTLTDAEKAEGWRLLFDGKSTEAWVSIGKTEFPAKGWVVEDGTLKHTAKGGGGDIVTKELFENFEFSWEWKIAPKGNSGVKYNLPDPKKAVGFEYQLMDDEGHADGKNRTHWTAGLYDLLEPSKDRKVKPPGEWNHSRLVVNGLRVEHWLNGSKTVEFEMGEAIKPQVAKSKYRKTEGFGEKTKSPILLQDHGDEVTFRNLKVRELPSK